MKLMIGLAVAGVAVAAVMPGRSHSTQSPEQLEARMARVAAGMQSARFAEVPDWRAEMTDAAAGKLMSRLICRQRGIGDAVRQGGTIRFAFTASTGEALPTIDVDGCAA